jgi:hypothetical protein
MLESRLNPQCGVSFVLVGTQLVGKLARNPLARERCDAGRRSDSTTPIAPFCGPADHLPPELTA